MTVVPVSHAPLLLRKRIHKLRIPFITSDEPMSFEELQRAEKGRRVLDRSKNERYLQHFQLWGTILPTVGTTLEFWLAFGAYVLTRCLMFSRVIHRDNVMLLDFRWVSVIGGFTTFLLVFYNNQIYSRFLAQYENAMKMEGRIFNSANLAKDHLPTAMAWQYVRYLNGAHLLGYVGLSQVYERDNFFVPLNEKQRFFTDDEVARLDQIDMNTGGNCYREVIGWTLRILYEAYERKHIDSVVYNLMISEVFQLRGCISVLYNYDDQPIPFLYVHLVYYLAFFYLLIVAFFVAITFPKEDFWGNIIALLIVCLNNLFTIGMIEIGRFMSDPFGADLCDLSVIHYITFTLVNSRRILTGKTFAFTNYETEAALERERPHKGAGFAQGELTSEKLHHRHAVPLDEEETIETESDLTPLKANQSRTPQRVKTAALKIDTTSDRLADVDEVIDF